MKILALQETDWLKRYPAQQHHLAEMMSLRGHEILAIDYELSWRKVKKEGLYSKRQVFENINKIHPNAKVKVIRPGFIRLPLLDYVSMLFSHRKEIKRQIKELHPDVIIGFGILNSYTAVSLTQGSRIPFVYYWIDVLHLLIPARPFRVIGKIVESAALKRADHILVINEKLKDMVVKMGAPNEHTQILRAGINIQQFSNSENRISIRNKYGIHDNDYVLFFMGFLYRFSGLKEVALTLAKLKNNNIKLLIVGEGDAYSDLSNIRDKYNLNENLILAGKKSYQEIPDFISASDICLLPSYPGEPIMQDIVPIKLYEYMAMGKPVISTKLPGVMAEFGNENGMLYVDKPEDVVDMAIELISNDNLSEIGSKARRFAEKNSWDKITGEFENILGKVIERKRNEKIY